MTSTPESGASAPQWGNDPARQAGQSGQQPGTETGSSPASEGGAGSSWSETSAGAGAPPGATGQQSQGYAMPPPMGYFAGSPVPREVTKVTFRRIVQYIIDGILVSIIPAIVWAIVGAADHGVTKVIGTWVGVIVEIAVMVWYWIFWPYLMDGQTLGMRLMKVRVISKTGGRASLWQLFGRWIFLIIDGLVAGLVGLIVILCSRYRQRIGDHVAQTLVVQADWQPQPLADNRTATVRAGSRM